MTDELPVTVPAPARVQWQQPMAESRPALPVVPTPYHHLWRSPRYAIWRSILVLVMGGVAFVAAQTLALLAALFIDSATGRIVLQDGLEKLGRGQIEVTPAFFITNNVSLILLIPIAMLLGWLVFGQRGGWASSVTGRLRWGWLARCVAILLPLWLVYSALEWWAMSQTPEGLGLRVGKDTWLMVAAIVLTTPVQAAGEEYGFRGLVNRAAASIFRNRTLGLVAGIVISSAAFMLAHGAGDLWLNIYYFCFGTIACIMAWRTGGLEAPIAMHAVNNVLAMAALPFSDMSSMFDRQAGVGSPVMLLGVVVQLIGLALVEWQARRLGIVRTSPSQLPAPRQELLYS